jgi:hypothetical protein
MQQGEGLNMWLEALDMMMVAERAIHPYLSDLLM